MYVKVRVRSMQKSFRRVYIIPRSPYSVRVEVVVSKERILIYSCLSIPPPIPDFRVSTQNKCITSGKR